MGHNLYRVKSYLNYRRSRQGIQNLHSPFLFELAQNTFYSDKIGSIHKSIEGQREKLERDNRQIEFEDFGAGGDDNTIKRVSISEVAKRSLKRPKYAKLMSSFVNYFGPSNVVELGTSLGITTAYLAAGNSNAKVWTVEGSEQINATARNVWNELAIENIRSFVFDLNEKLASFYKSIGRIDLLFVDANHRKEALIRYILQALPYLHEKSVVIVDDINWSEDMNAAWNLLQQRKIFTMSIDIFEMGILFLNKDLSKEDFILRY